MSKRRLKRTFLGAQQNNSVPLSKLDEREYSYTCLVHRLFKSQKAVRPYIFEGALRAMRDFTLNGLVNYYLQLLLPVFVNWFKCFQKIKPKSDDTKVVQHSTSPFWEKALIEAFPWSAFKNVRPNHVSTSETPVN